MIKMPSDCSSYESCDAPLCPLSEELDSCVWYCDESICMATKFTKLHWVRIQKRLKKYKASADGFFTKEKLEKMYACSAHTKGENPDSRKNMKWVDPYPDTQNDPIPLPQSYGLPLKKKLGHCRHRSGLKERQLVLIQ